MGAKFQTNRRSVGCWQLEPRVLFSGSPFGEVGLESIDFEWVLEAQSDDVSAVVEKYDNLDSNASENRVVLIDQHLDNLNQLVESLQDSLGYDTQIVYLPDEVDSIDALSDLLDQFGNIDELHVVSHGFDGGLQIGNLVVDVEALGDVNVSSKLQEAFSADSEIYLWGCSIAESQAGRDFVSTLSGITSSVVWASDDVTGFGTLGGDWTLEYSSNHSRSMQLTGSIEDWFGALATIVVTNTNDLVNDNTSGATALATSAFGDGISLREAILAANNSGADVIEFQITDPLVNGFHTISLTSALPTISGKLTIDGRSDSDYAGTPIIVLDGSAAGASSSGLVIGATANASVVQGLAIHSFGANGIEVLANNVSILGNYLGTDGTGAVALGNGASGIYLESVSTVIGGTTAEDSNVIVGNALYGVNVGPNSSAISILGNRIGVGVGGQELGNTIGVHLSSLVFDNKVGGVNANEGNTIAFNTIGIGTNASAGANNSFLGNQYFGNAIGIDLHEDGISVNDSEDADAATTHVLNHPEITGVTHNGTDLVVTMDLDLTAGDYRIELYDSGSDTTSSFNRQGSELIGFATFTSSGAAGSQSFTINTTVANRQIWNISATATQKTGPTLYGATSEFSAPLVEAAIDQTTEFLVNTSTAHTQVTSGEGRGSQNAVAIGADGSYVVGWSDNNADGSGWGVFSQRFDYQGSAIGSAVRINQVASDDQSMASVAMDGSGRYAVVWNSQDQDGDNAGVYMRRFNADGTAIDTNDLLINSASTDGDQFMPAIAINDSGEMIVTWFDDDNDTLQAIQFDMDTVASGGIVPGTTLAIANNSKIDQPSVDINNSGDFVIAYELDKKPYLKRYNAAGIQVGSAININTLNFFNAEERFPVVALQDDGEIFVAYESTIVPGIWLKHYDAGGNSYGLATQVHGGSGDTSPSITKGNDGSIFVTYEAFGDGDDKGVYVQKYSSAGVKIGSAFQVNESAAQSQHLASLAAINQDNFVVVWSGNGTQVNNIDSSGVFVRQYGTANAAAAPVNNAPVVTNGAPINLVEDTNHRIAVSELGYFDADGDVLDSIFIEEVNGGTLLLNGSLVSVSDTIMASDIAAGNLVFAPNENESGTFFANIKYQVSDGVDTSLNVGVLSFNVISQVDAAQIDIGDALTPSVFGSVVNTELLGNQDSQQLAALTNGNYVIVWASQDGYTADGDDGIQIFAQVLDSTGAKVGAQFAVSNNIGTDQISPSVAGLADGGFVVAWTDNATTSDILVQRFDAAGTRLNLNGTSGATSPTNVAQNSAFHQMDASVTATETGFFVSWGTRDTTIAADSTDVVGRFFDLNGTATDEFLINQTVVGVQRTTRSTALDGHRVLVTWLDQNGDSFDLRGRIVGLGADLSVGSEFTINSITTQKQWVQNVASLDSQGFVVVWQSEAVDGSGTAVVSRRFDLDGNAIDGTEVTVNVETTGNQSVPDVVGSPDGSYTVFWQSLYEDGDGTAIVGRHYDASSNSFGNEFVASSNVVGNQRNVDAIRLLDGQWVIAWDNDFNAAGRADFGTEVVVSHLQSLVAGTEDVFIPLNLDISLQDADGSDWVDSIVISQLPAGATLTDGVNSFTSGSPTSVDITSWNRANLALRAPANFNGAFSIDVAVSTTNGSSTTTVNESVTIQVGAVNDVINKADFSQNTSSDTTITISAAQVLSPADDPDIAAATAPAVSPFLEYIVGSSTTDTPNAFSIIEWTSETGGAAIEWNAGEASIVGVNNSQIGNIDQAFDHSAAGILDLSALSGNQAAIEIWFRPDSLAQNGVLFDWGSSSKGISLIQFGDQVRLDVTPDQNYLGFTVPTFELVGEGLVANEFNQAVFVIDTSGALVGDPTSTDLALYLNGQLVDIAQDIGSLPGFDAPSLATTVGVSEAKMGIGGVNGTFASTTVTSGASTFTGDLGRVAVFNGAIDSDEIYNRFQDISNAVEVIEVEGNALTGAQTFVLASGAKVNVLSNGSVEYDPNSKFDYLANGQSASDSFTYKTSDQYGATKSIDVTLNITGANQDPPIAVDDTISSVPSSGTYTINIADLLVNDSDPDGDTFSLVDLNRPVSGTLVDNGDGTLSYTPAGSPGASDSFEYTIIDQALAISHYWNLDNGGVDQIGGQDLSLFNTGIGQDGQGLLFNENLASHATTGDFSYANSFTLTFDFNLPSVSGTGYRYMYSHGDPNGEGIQIFVRETNSGSPSPNTLATIVRDADDALSYYELDINAAALVGGWHTYSLVVEENVGSKVYIDGILQGQTSKGGDGINPTGSLVIGGRSDYSSIRYMSGSIGDVLIMDRAVSATELTTFRNVLDASTATVTVSFNAPPNATNDSFVVAEDSTLSSTVAGNDSDPDGDALAYTIVTGPAKGSLSLNSNGSFTFDTAGDFETLAVGDQESVTFTYQIQDTLGQTDTATATIVVTGANDAPQQDVPGPKSFTINEDNSLAGSGLLSGVSDIDGDSLSVLTTPVAGPSHGTLTLRSNGTFDYVPALNFFGTDQFVYRVLDGNGGRVDITVNLTVNPVNDAPQQTVTGARKSYALNEDQTLTGTNLLTDVTDADGDTLSVVTTPVTSTSHGVLVLNSNGTFMYQPTANFSGSDQFVYQVSDGNGGTIDITADIVVGAVNDAPVQTVPNEVKLYVVDEDQTLTANGLLSGVTDADGDSLSVLTTPVAGPSHGTLTLRANGTFDYVPEPNFFGTDQFVYRVVDGHGGRVDITVSLTVNPVNDAPQQTVTGARKSYAVNEDQTLTGSNLLTDVTDADGDTLSVVTTPVTSTSHGLLVLNSNGTFTYQPTANFSGSDQFVYQVSDGNGGTIDITADIAVGAVNDAPVQTVPNQVKFYFVDEDQTLTANGLISGVTDADGDALFVRTAPVSGPTHGDLVLRPDGRFRYIPNADFNGTDEFIYRILDGNGGRVDIKAVINVNSIDDAPVFLSTNEFRIHEGQTSVGVVQATDVESSVVYSLSGSGADSARFTIDSTTGQLTLVQTPDFEAPHDADSNNEYAVQVEVTDGTHIVFQDVTVIVENVIENALAFGDSYTTTEGGTLVSANKALVLNDSIVEQTPYTVHLVSNVSHGTLSLSNNGSFTYQHDGSETATDVFVYEIIEASGHRTSATVSFAISLIDDLPVAADDVYTMVSNGAATIDDSLLLANDYDNDSAISGLQITQQPDAGTVTIDGTGNLLFTPNQTFTETSFSYVVESNGATSNEATVTILAAAPLPPTNNPTNTNSNTNTESTTETTSEQTNDPIVDESNDPSESLDSGTAATDGTNKVESANSNDQTGTNGPANNTADVKNTDLDLGDGFDIGDFDVSFASNVIYDSAARVFDARTVVEISLATTSIKNPITTALVTEPFDWLANYYYQLDSSDSEIFIPADISAPVTASAAAGLLSVGYLAWMIRGGVLLTTFMSSLPAWQSFDPLVVVQGGASDRDGGESIEEIVDV
ncbi:MAG: tandem-95 repeat protein [Pirellulaceae bacterium]